MSKIFIVRLSEPLNEALTKPETPTIYKIAQKSGVTFNTVKKYIAGDITTPYLTGEVIKLCEFFGLDWHDPQVVEPIEAEDKSSGQIKTLFVPA